SPEHLRGLAMTTTLAQGSPSRSLRSAWVIAGLVLACLVCVAFLVGLFELTLAFLFIGRPAQVGPEVVLNFGVVGWLTYALLVRLLRRRFRLPRPRMLAANALAGYGRGWGVGVAILSAADLARWIGSIGPPIG